MPNKNVFCNLPNEQLPEDEWRRIHQRMQSGGPASGFCSWGMIAPEESAQKVIEQDRATLQRLGVTGIQLASALAVVVNSGDKLSKDIEITMQAAAAPHNAEAEKHLVYAYNHQEKEKMTAYWAAKHAATKAGLDAIGMPMIGMYPGESPHVPDTLTHFTAHGLDLIVGNMSWMGAQQCPFQNQSCDSTYHGYRYGCTDIVIVDHATGDHFCFNTLLIHMIAVHDFFEGTHIRSIKTGELIANPWRFDIEKACAMLRKLLNQIPPTGDRDALKYYIDFPKEPTGVSTTCISFSKA